MPCVLGFSVMCVALLNGFVNPMVIMLSKKDYAMRIKSLMFHLFGNVRDERMVEFNSKKSSLKNFKRSQQHKYVPLIKLFIPESNKPQHTITHEKSKSVEERID